MIEGFNSKIIQNQCIDKDTVDRKQYDLMVSANDTLCSMLDDLHVELDRLQTENAALVTENRKLGFKVNSLQETLDQFNLFKN